ncbi:MAG: NBR1-Ig-like domain-containing protein, partial [Anaerolineae bacterium]
MSKKAQRIRLAVIAACVLLLVALACGPLPTVQVTIVVTTTPPPSQLPLPSPEVTPPTQEAIPGCTLNARWVADVTVPDNTAFAPNTPFVKTWRVRNSGTCAW